MVAGSRALRRPTYQQFCIAEEDCREISSYLYDS